MSQTEFTALSDAWERLETIARSRNMTISTVESDEVNGMAQRWIAWVKRTDIVSPIQRGQYGAIGKTAAEAMNNLSTMLEASRG